MSIFKNKVGHTFRLREDEIRRKRASLLCNTKIRSELEAQYVSVVMTYRRKYSEEIKKCKLKVNLQEYLRDGEKYHSGSVRNEKNMKLLKVFTPFFLTPYHFIFYHRLELQISRQWGRTILYTIN